MKKIFFATDIHGSEICFKKFINAGKFYSVDIIILGGDITGKMIVPIIKNQDGSITAQLFGREIKAKNTKEINELMRKIGNIGYYPYTTTKEEMNELLHNEKVREELFKDLMVERLKKWIDYAEEKLKGTKIKCYIQPGNDDHDFIDNIIETSNHITNPEGKVIQIEDRHEMISTGYANMTPWQCPRDITEEELKKKILEMIIKVDHPEDTILNIHPPPYDTEIDLAPLLDEEFNVVIKQGEIVYTHVGSRAVREIIKEYQPLVGLHGHIHESRGVSRIGRTICLNPGSEYTEGILRGVIINVGKGKIKSYQFTSG